MNKCLKIELKELKKDPALKPKGRGARKLIVTKIKSKFKERESKVDIWSAPKSNGNCNVLQISNAEMAIFNQTTAQDRHYHKVGTEIYMVIEGAMKIIVEDKEYQLNQGDSIVVHPFSVHEVKNKGSRFMCRVITLNCEGEKDKYKIYK